MSLKYLTPQQVSDRYAGRISPRTLANWRYLGNGPRFVRIGGRIAYRLEDLEAWETRRTVTCTAEYRS
ncbi:helix-turn-helix transcriptional regulator [Ralstonia nicotianae]